MFFVRSLKDFIYKVRCKSECACMILFIRLEVRRRGNIWKKDGVFVYVWKTVC